MKDLYAKIVFHHHVPRDWLTSQCPRSAPCFVSQDMTQLPYPSFRSTRNSLRFLIPSYLLPWSSTSRRAGSHCPSAHEVHKICVIMTGSSSLILRSPCRFCASCVHDGTRGRLCLCGGGVRPTCSRCRVRRLCSHLCGTCSRGRVCRSAVTYAAPAPEVVHVTSVVVSHVRGTSCFSFFFLSTAQGTVVAKPWPQF